jgi:hypothetical protein
MALIIPVISGDNIEVDFRETGDKNKFQLVLGPSNLTIKELISVLKIMHLNNNITNAFVTLWSLN